MRGRLALRLLAGALILNVLIDLPAFSAAAPAASLLAPSLDLLVVMALLMMVSSAASKPRAVFSIVVSILLALLLGWKSVDRFGPAEVVRLFAGASALGKAALAAGGVLTLAAAAAAAFAGCRLVLRGFEDAVLRNVFLAAAAVCAVTQALTGLRVFSPSEIPKIAREIFRGN